MSINSDNIEFERILALKMIKGVGNIGAFKLLKHFQTATSIFKSNSLELKQAGLKPDIIQQIVDFDFNRLEPILSWANQPDNHIINFQSPLYPPLLKQINNPPLLLFALGEPEILLTPQVAVVGSRAPTPQGVSNTQMLSAALSEQGFTVTSGLAVGIDGEAHRSALKTNGYTIAVTGTGLNRVYPAVHRELAHQIAKNGVLVSENLPDATIDRGSFPQRNRLIAGLSLGTLVIEAAQKSGSLITANLAAEAGREVYAIPGSIHNPLAKGCHKLIKEGAKLVESIEDIIEDLPSIAKAHTNLSTPVQQQTLSSEDKEFLQYIDYEVTSIDSIVARSQLTVAAVTNKLLLLELDGWIINHSGGYIRQL